MAYEIIGTYKIYEYKQDELWETQHITHEDGSITEEEVMVKESFHTWVNLTVSEEKVREKNRTNLKATMRAYAISGTSEFLFNRHGSSTKDNSIMVSDTYEASNLGTFEDESSSTASKKTIQPNVESSYLLCEGEWKNVRLFHNFIDGGRNGKPIRVKSFFDYTTTGIVGFDGKNSQTINTDVFLSDLDKSTIITTANDFTDEDNPILTYSILPSYGRLTAAYVSNPLYFPDYKAYENEELNSVQIGLSLDGITMDIYRDVPTDSSEYIFELTEDEREYLRSKVTDSTTVPIYYITKTTRTLHYHYTGAEIPGYPSITQDFYNTVKRNFSIIGVYPQLNPTVKDIKPETLALTGDENTFVRYESMAEYAINALPSKYATIVNQYVQCGSKKIENLPYGVIDDVESGDFNFYVLDSRGMQAVSGVFKNLIPYVKPTCYQKLEIDIAGETGAQINLTMSGSYFNDSFGAADNEYKFEVRYTDDNGDMGEWITLSQTPTFKGTTYELKASFTGFNYGNAYIFQSRITDKLNVVQSNQYTVQMLPVFDWGEKDFNFNVPVNINAETLNMNGKTIIRHNETANNTVLSAPNGHIYVRPRGTDETDGQTIFYNNGDVDFSGNTTFGGSTTFNSTANFNYSLTVGGYILNDYVIETGSASMGSNGTWYWQKWLSGKAEAWGCRNFGNMAVSTAWGSLYRSEVFTQDLPDDVFIRTPDAININFVHTNAGGWISKYDNTAPSAVTTGSFVVIRPEKGNITPTNIGFHIIGEWY